MGGLIPLTDASRRPARFAVVTTLLIVTNALVFIQELTRGEAFVTQWSAIPVDILAGRYIQLLSKYVPPGLKLVSSPNCLLSVPAFHSSGLTFSKPA